MSSGGQAVGGIVGAIAGVFLAPATAGASMTWALYGAQIGMTVGGLLDPPKGPNIKGPRLDDLSVQTSTYGASIPRIYGTNKVAGNVIWLEGDKIREKKKKKKSGGKGGTSQTTTTYSYFATFAVGLADCRQTGPVLGIKRLWLGANLVYDGASPAISGIITSGKQKAYWKLYTGADNQGADPRIQADKGGGSASAYPGLCYIVFYDLPLEKYSNSLAAVQVQAELVASGSQSACPYGIQFAADLPVTAPYTTINSSMVLSVAVKNGLLRVGTSGKISLYTMEGVYKGLEKMVSEVDGYAYGYPCQNDPDSYFGTYWNTSLAQTWAVMVDKGVPIPATNGGGYFFCAMIRVGDYLFGITKPSGAPQDTLWAVKSGAVVASIYLGSSNDHYTLTTDDTYLYVTTTAATTEYDTSLTQTGYWTGVRMADSSHGGASFCAVSHRKLYGYSVGDATGVSLYTLNADGTVTRSCISAAYTYPAVRPIGQEYWLSRRHFYTRQGPIVPDDVPLSEIVQAECLQSNLLIAGDLDVTDLASDMVHGYKVSRVAPIRGALEPLQSVWPFDIRQHGYVIQFVRRGNSAVAAIPAVDLDARTGGAAPGVLIAIPREMDSQIPRKVLLRYLDAGREYDTGEAIAQRYNTDAVDVTELEVAVVLTATEAARAAEVLLYAWWRERGADIPFRLPPSYLHLEPADVVSITDGAGTVHTLRLTSANYDASGVVECMARREADAYTSTALAATGQSTGSVLYIPGPTIPTLMDLPALTAAGDTPGYYAAFSGVLATWPGGTLFGSLDAGQNWTELDSATLDAEMGVVETALGAATCFDRIDAAGAITVTLYAGTLASVTELEVLAGANHFAYGAAGRWEILAAKTVTLNGDGSYTLRDFIRGRLGTEQHASTHQAGDRLVLLNADEVLFINSSAAAIGLPGVYRAITFGESLEDESDTAFTYNAENIKPRSPIQLNGSRHPSTNDWTITWVRRARINTEWRDLVDVPLDEASEAYEAEVYASSAYTTLKRTLTGLSSATAAYTSAQQVADFGANQATLYLKVYQISATVGRGHPLFATITR